MFPVPATGTGYQISWPTGAPESVSRWRFFGVMRLTSSFERELRLDDRHDDEYAVVYAHVDYGVLGKPGLLGERLGNPQRQAVAPFLNASFHVRIQEDSTRRTLA